MDQGLPGKRDTCFPIDYMFCLAYDDITVGK
jgi:hypothetical protein